MVYFPFPENRISYDCRACGFKCCRGYGTSGIAQEIQAMLGLEPSLQPFLQKMGFGENQGAAMELVTLAPSCFMLGEEGDCAIQKELGRKLKPWTCRLYPFNDYLKIGDTFVFNINVIQNETVCPFKISPKSGPRVGSSQVTYKSVAADLGEWNSEHPVWQRASLGQIPELTAVASQLIALETQVRDRLAELPDETSALETLTVGLGLSEPKVRRMFEALSRQFQIPFDLKQPAPLLSVFLPSIRMGYLARFYRQGYSTALEVFPRYAGIGILYAMATARLLKTELEADLLLRVFARLGRWFQLGALLDQRVRLSGTTLEKNERINFEVNGPEALALVHLLRKSGTPSTLRELISKSVCKGGKINKLSDSEAISYFSLLSPLASHLEMHR